MVSFAYDQFGRRIKNVTSSGTSIFAYDSDNLIEETNSSGAVVARYSQGLNIDEPLAMLRSSTTSYYNADGLGSITSLSNGAGARRWPNVVLGASLIPLTSKNRMRYTQRIANRKSSMLAIFDCHPVKKDLFLGELAAECWASQFDNFKEGIRSAFVGRIVVRGFWASRGRLVERYLCSILSPHKFQPKNAPLCEGWQPLSRPR